MMRNTLPPLASNDLFGGVARLIVRKGISVFVSHESLMCLFARNLNFAICAAEANLCDEECVGFTVASRRSVRRSTLSKQQSLVRIQSKSHGVIVWFEFVS
jgi:hypothetical protein